MALAAGDPRRDPVLFHIQDFHVFTVHYSNNGDEKPGSCGLDQLPCSYHKRVQLDAGRLVYVRRAMLGVPSGTSGGLG